MARIAVSIGAAVGLRNGVTPLPNQAGDLNTVAALFDRISGDDGGTANIPGPWATSRAELIAEIAGQIGIFQTANSMAAVDYALDPLGGTLRLMNRLAADPALSATVAPSPPDWDEDLDISIEVAATSTFAGTRQLGRAAVAASFTRRLVRVEGSSIRWFGVALPSSFLSGAAFPVPHVFFTPTPWQGGYQNPGYESFASWGRLWADYTRVIGGQIAASGVGQILVIPFYKNGQERDLGAFLDNWKEVISAVVTAAVNDINPYILSDSYTFSSMVSSSFSNGWVAHRTFYGQGSGAGDATLTVFDLDGQAGGSHWRPSNGVIYMNVAPPYQGNPSGNIWYVGGRWGNFTGIYQPVNTHSYCVNFLLFHGLSQYCS